MKCPLDNTTLTIADRAGVEIDYCPECRGAWLDRGEIDKIIDRSNIATDDRSRREPRYNSDDDGRRDDYKRDHSYGKRRKREGFLGEIFDF